MKPFKILNDKNKTTAAAAFILWSPVLTRNLSHQSGNKEIIILNKNLDF
jgi:hypothetical protein